MSNAKPIPTEFDGIKFRSRLEARWAVAFRAAGIKYEYEYEGYQLPDGWYLPDFWLPRLYTWAEVKSNRFTPRELRMCQQLADATESGCILLADGPDYSCYPEVHWHELRFGSDNKFRTGEEREVELQYYDLWSRRNGGLWPRGHHIYPRRMAIEKPTHDADSHPVEIARRHRFWNPAEAKP